MIGNDINQENKIKLLIKYRAKVTYSSRKLWRKVKHIKQQTKNEEIHFSFTASALRSQNIVME